MREEDVGADSHLVPVFTLPRPTTFLEGFLRCGKNSFFDNESFFTCPRPFDDVDEIYCCGTGDDTFCCADPDAPLDSIGRQ